MILVDSTLLVIQLTSLKHGRQDRTTDRLHILQNDTKQNKTNKKREVKVRC